MTGGSTGLLALALAACSGSVAMPAAVQPPGRDALRQDVEGYATAACLLKQQSAALRDQGDGWAANIVQRPSFRLEPFRAVAAAVDAEVAKGGMARIMVENPPMTLKDLPIQYCAEIVDAPAVRAAIERTVSQLSRPAPPPR